MTPISKDRLLQLLDKSLPLHDAGLKHGKTYMGRIVPDQYFIVQDWCFAQGSTPRDSRAPDLTIILQGVEYIFQAASGLLSNEQILNEAEIRLMMGYLDRPEEFEHGALRMFDELRELMQTQLLTLPKGQAVINIVNMLQGYEDLFA